MAMPSVFYGNPERVLELEERRQCRETLGCSGCRHRGGYLGFGKYECGQGHAPGWRGWCRHWRDRED